MYIPTACTKINTKWTAVLRLLCLWKDYENRTHCGNVNTTRLSLLVGEMWSV